MIEFQTFLSCWANQTDLATAIDHADEWGYHGVEGPPPENSIFAKDLADELADRDLPYIAEVATGGDYVPAPGLSVTQHLDELERHLAERVAHFRPIAVNVLGGSDRWSFAESVDFFGRGLQLGEQFGHQIWWETHRSRPTFSPWATRELLLELPEMQLTCDFSHWCAVCERLVLDEEPELLKLCAEHCGHLHARVGYEQGPQVPDPRDSLYFNQLNAHLRWWKCLLSAAEERGLNTLTATPEFGPDGYLHLSPHDHLPAANLPELNCWMAKKLTGITKMNG